MHELEPGFDQISLLEPPELAHILEDAPGEGAVALALLAEFVERAQEPRSVLRIDAILDLDQNRTAIVRNLLGGLRPAANGETASGRPPRPAAASTAR